MKKKLLSLVLALCMAFGSAAALPEGVFNDSTGITASAETFTDVNFEVTFCQEDARSMLAMINDFRQGSEAWAWSKDNSEKVYYNGLGKLQIDYELEKAAMQRAAELVAYYAHERPNGESCSTAYSSAFNNTYRGENIAIGYRSVEEMFEGWKEDDDDYSGQGHRRNMLSSNFSVVAIAHVKYGGMDYWVQEFSSKVVDTAYKAPNNSSTPVTVEVKSEKISKNAPAASPSSMTVYDADESVQLPEVTRNVRLEGQWYYAPDIKLETSYSWKIKSGSDVVKLSGKNLLLLKAGDAVLTATCSDGSTVDVNVKVNHRHTYKETVVPGTCLSQGYTLYECTRCEYSYKGNYTSYGDHDWSSWEITWEPTCTGKGIRARTCKTCGRENSEYVDPLGHSLKKTAYKAPTCTQDGNIAYYYCSRCKKYFTDSNAETEITKADTVVSKKGHDWSDWTTTKKATCTEAGSKKRGCKNCDETETETIKKLGHNYVDTVVKPTCTKQGYTLHKCSRCGDSYKDTYTDKTAHTWSKWTTSKAATCTSDGEQTRTCSVCKKTETKTLSKLGHNYVKTVVAPTCKAQGYTLHKCSRCGDSYKDTYTAKTAHTWSKWTTTKAATCTADGEQTRTCSVCKKTETKTLSKLGHNYVKTVVAPTCKAQGYTLHKCSRCGDSYKDTYTAKTAHKWSAWKTTGFDFAKKTSTQTKKCTKCGKTITQTTKNAITRIAGANRFDSAAVISRAMNKTSDTVIIATGLTFNDALVAVPLASVYNAPLLLATEKHITAQTEAELKRLGAKNVIVVSTNGAVGDGAKAELSGYETTYIEGKTCFETAAKVAKALQDKTKKAPDTIFFATDETFADALSASPVAAIKGAPIMYLKKTGSIDKATADYLKSVKGKVKNAYIIGGDGVISNAMMKNVANALGLTVNKTVVRVAGVNRYETCVAVNNKFKSVLTGDGICVAKGLDFPDALAGGVYAAATKQALFLADGKKLQDYQNTYLKGKNASKITVFGGTGAVPDELVKLIAKASV